MRNIFSKPFTLYLFSEQYWDWVDLKMSSNEKWLEGGFALNDDQIETPAAKEIRLSDYTDMSPLGNWIPEIPTFNSSATEQEKSGI